MSMWKKLAGGAAFTALATAAVVAPAQAQQTTSSVRGEVAANGVPIPGASVKITHTPTGATINTKTNDAGVFDARGLRVGGPYTVEVSAPTYAGRKVDDLFLQVGDTLKLDFAMEIAADRIVVQGTKDVVIATADVGTKTTLDRATMETVVTTRRDIRDLTRRDPLVTLDNVTRGTGPTGGIYIAGSTPRLNRITIDGVKSADDFGLNTGGMSTTRGPVSIDAIEQLTVQAVPFDVSEGDFTGGAVNLVLRGGTNTFHGSAFINYQNEGFAGKRIRGQNNAIRINLENYGAFLSGPIWPDRAFAAASYEYYDSLDPNAFFGPRDLGYPTNLASNDTCGNTTTTPPANPNNPKTPNCPNKLSLASLAPVLAAYGTYGVASAQPVGSWPRVTPTNDIKNSLRFDVNITDQQRLQATYRHAESSLYKTSGSATSISPVSNWYIQGELEDNYALQLNSNWTDNLSTEARVSYRSYIRHQEPPQGQQFGLTTVCLEASSSGDPYQCLDSNSQASSIANNTPTGTPSFNVGPDQFRQANLLKTKNLSTDFVANYTLDTHLLKVGFQSKNIDIFNVFVPQARGVYYFDSVADFNAGKVGRLQYQNNPSGNPNDAAAAFSYGQNSLFAQDSWDMLSNVTLNYGLRYDFYKSDDKPALNAGFKTRYGFDNQQTYDGLSVVMPRVSLKYDVTPDIEVSGGIGLFSGGFPDVFLSNSFSNTGVLFYGVDIQRRSDGTFVDGVSSAVLDFNTANSLMTVNKATYGRSVPSIANTLLNPNTVSARTAETASLAPDFKIPSDYKANLAFRWNLPGDYLFGLDFVGSRAKEGLAFRDLRARPLLINGAQQFTPDGRLRYDGLNVTLANRIAQGLPVNTNTDFTNLGAARDIQAFNPDQDSWTQTFAVSIDKHWDFGVGASLAYVHGNAETYGGLSEFATTPSFYAEQFSDYDPNVSTFGIASNRIADQVKATLSYEHRFFENFVTRVTLFAEARSGRPFSFTMADAASNRGSVFGVNRQDQLLYVPDISGTGTAIAAVGTVGASTKFVSPSANERTGAPVTVFIDNTALTGFTTVVNQWNLPKNAIVPKGFGRNPDVNQIDLQLAQEIPVPFLQGHKVTLTFDMKNLLNFLNNDWGVVEEFGGSRGSATDRIISVQCADPVTGAPIASSSSACSAYRYSSFNTGSGTVGNGTPAFDTSSRWFAQIGLRYSF